MRAFCLLLTVLVAQPAAAQMTRERANPGGPVDELFWAPTVILTPSTTNLPKGNLNFTILHAFAPVSTGADDLFGLDGTANIRFGLDYGLTDRLSLGLGRSRFDKQFDARFKAKLLRQTKDGRMPLEVAVTGDVAVTTQRNGFSFNDRLNYHAGLLLARRFSDRLSLQVTPMAGHFNTVYITRNAAGNVVEERNTQLAVGIVGRWVFSELVAVTWEYLPVLSGRSDGTVDALAIGLDLETGGHVFQLFLASSNHLTPQSTLARNTERFFDGDFRFGFNVNRVFGR